MPDWRVAFEETAAAFIADFVVQSSEYSLDPEPVIQGATNFVTRGHHNGERVVFKYYSNPERWRNELFCLQHFSSTEIVPRVHHSITERLTVMTCVPGYMPRTDGIDDAVLSDPSRREDLGRQIGRVTGKLVSVPLPTDDDGLFPPPGFEPLPWFVWSTNLRGALEHYVELGKRIQREVPEYGAPIFTETLTLLAHQSEGIEGARKVLYHDDFGNLHISEGNFMGLFDIENCRLGTEAMQLSSGVGFCLHYGLGMEPFLEGYEEVTGNRSCGEDHLALLAMTQLQRIIRITDEGKWTGSEAAKEDTQRQAEGSLENLREAVLIYREGVDLNRWFPSLAE